MKHPARIRLIGFSGVLAAILLSGCTTDNVPINPKYHIQDQYPFIQNEKITREEIVFQLGNPSNVLEDGRILTYQFVRHKDGDWYPHAPLWKRNSSLRTWHGPTSSLILIFGPDGILEKYNIVLIFGTNE